MAQWGTISCPLVERNVLPCSSAEKQFLSMCYCLNERPHPNYCCLSLFSCFSQDKQSRCVTLFFSVIPQNILMSVIYRSAAASLCTTPPCCLISESNSGSEKKQNKNKSTKTKGDVVKRMRNKIKQYPFNASSEMGCLNCTVALYKA